MSLRAMTWAMDSAPESLSPTQRHVLLVLADFVNDQTMTAYPSLATLAARTGLSTRAVRTALRALEESGLIATSIKAARGSGDSPIPSDRRPNLYRWTAFETHPQATPSYPPRGTTFPSREEGDSPRERNHVPRNPYKNPYKNLLLPEQSVEAVVEAIRTKLPNAPKWLAKRALPALDKGWTITALVDEAFKESIEGARSANAVIAHRFEQLAQVEPKFPNPPMPAWCGKCSEFGRWIDVIEDGASVVARCPDCHPEGVRRAS